MNMPSTEELLVWGRIVERLVAAGIGALAVVLGYRLFVLLPQVRSGEARLALPGEVSIYVSRIGPGLFFLLFGAAVIVSGLQGRLELGGNAADSGAPRIAYAAPAMPAPVPASDPAREAETRRTLADLARLQQGLDGLALAPPERTMVAHALREARLAVLRTAWDARWGEFEAFRHWAHRPEGRVPPSRTVLAWWQGGAPEDQR